MQILLTTYSNRKDVVAVTNQTKKDLTITFKEKDYTFKPEEKQIVPSGLVQTYIYDFATDNPYAEERRRRMMGISHYKITQMDELYVYEKPKKTVEEESKKEAEPTFTALKELNDEVCKATTKSGKRCKNEAIVDGFCKIHGKKED